MRLFLLPISTRRTLIYCERAPPLPSTSTAKPPISERIIAKASETWAKWERAEKGWQKQLTVQGNRFLKRIPYEEWGLKSFPPGTKKRLEEAEREGEGKWECLFPGRFFGDGGKGQVERAKEVLGGLAGERQALHRKRLWWSVLGMPVTAPFALVPIIPNIPFFYLVFRAYSHYRALYGGKLLSHLISKDLVTITDSPELDSLYAAGLLHPHRDASRGAPKPTSTQIEQVARVVEAQTHGGKEDVMVLQRWNGKLIAERFKLPEMEMEIERAVEQVEKVIEKERVELEDEKREVMRAAAAEGGRAASMSSGASTPSAEPKREDVANPDIKR
ncbi:uncharacterized protein LTR77_000047 [Saxophila tyrrhenica]|uniref:UvrC family homology region profile domain-containing protein n=1 Tax=Saxophila tyrrhenica TaxID=1690608 RepID=A0AAV9PLP7_9PEZI|nr:hypothetical protein LTR77_000047 [Saxophila tyrrhenica]